jgi:DnaK suppressor protein
MWRGVKFFGGLMQDLTTLKDSLKEALFELEERKPLLGTEPAVEIRGDSGADSEINYSETTVRANLAYITALELYFAERTLEKIDEGTYRICDECEEEIPSKRLKLRPHCPYCVSCLSKLEKDFKLRFEVKSMGTRSVLNYSAKPTLVPKAERNAA